MVARDELGWVLVDATDPLAFELARSLLWRRVPDEELTDDPRFSVDGIVLFLHADTKTSS